LAASLLVALVASAQEPDYPIRPVLPASVKLQDAFWTPRLEANRAVTIPHILRQLETQGSLGGFAVLAGNAVEKYHGYMFGDSDVYKTMEGIVCSLRDHPDRAVENRVEQLTRTIASAQAADGYLMPHLQIAEPHYRHFSEETTRTCESYSMGHMIESAVAHFEATGRKPYLDVAVKCADLLARVHREGKDEQISGHPEIELALVRLYRATGDRKYLKLASSYVKQARSQVSAAWSGGRPFLADEVVRGHAVAATYLYCGATDVAVLTGDAQLLALLEGKWRDMVSRKLYLTGGTGLPAGEAFGRDYDLPNASAYCETCAAIANIFWNHRLFLASGEARYADVLERALYNAVLPAVSLQGNRFFYGNPLESDGKRPFSPGGLRERFPWCECPCCPTNIVRFLPQISGYAYATRNELLYVNLFMAGTAKLKMGETTVELRQETRYPWDGQIKLTLNPDKPATFGLRMRIPGWARNQPVPSDLYRYDDVEKPEAKLAVNGQPADLTVENGFASLTRAWKAGDVVTLELAMPVRRVVAHDTVSANRDRFAVERGPLVYCAEGADNKGRVLNKVLGRQVKFASWWQPDLLGGIVTIRMTPAAADDAMILIPYYAWCHRGPNEMAVWLRVE